MANIKTMSLLQPLFQVPLRECRLRKFTLTELHTNLFRHCDMFDIAGRSRHCWVDDRKNFDGKDADLGQCAAAQFSVAVCKSMGRLRRWLRHALDKGIPSIRASPPLGGYAV